MKFEPVRNNQNAASPLVIGRNCGCSAVSNAVQGDKLNEFLKLPYVNKIISTPAGPVPEIKTKLTSDDRMEHLRARVSAFRMNYKVGAGLYAIGSPTDESDIFVTANYKMSFDCLRASLEGINGWILVLDTAGINVWCAAGKGTFGTDELVKRIKISDVEKCVRHRRIIVPQLGAPGINSAEVMRAAGFRVYYGPVRAHDIKKYIDNGYRADEEMRSVKFPMKDRAVLIPIELNAVFKKSLYFIIAVFIYAGLTPAGIIFKDSIQDGYPLVIAGLCAVLTGSVITPLLLPAIPFRSFALKGWITGILLFAVLDKQTELFAISGAYGEAAVLILFPLLSSYLALQFTGASTFTSLSGVQKEIKFSLPLYIAGIIVSFMLFVMSKLSGWGIL